MDDGNVADLRAARWESGHLAHGLPPEDAIYAALRHIEGGGIKALHVCVVIAEETPEAGLRTHTFSAGAYNVHGSSGMLQAAATRVLRQ